MVGNANAVTAAPAWTPAPTVQKAESVSPSGGPVGNTLPVAGRGLPVGEMAEARAEVERAVQRLQQLASATQRSLRFEIDEVSGRTIIRVLDDTTKEVVRQIPSPEVLAVMQHLERVGALLDTHG